MQALRKQTAATEQLLEAEKAAKYAADQEAVQLQKSIDDLERSVAQER